MKLSYMFYIWGFNQMNITVLECPTWREKQSTSDKKVILDVIKAVKTEKRMKRDGF